MIIVEGYVRMENAGDFEKVREAAEAQIASSRAEGGCIDYTYALDVLDPQITVERETHPCDLVYNLDAAGENDAIRVLPEVDYQFLLTASPWQVGQLSHGNSVTDSLSLQGLF